MKKEDQTKLLLLLGFVENCDSIDGIPLEYAFDEELNDCLMYMYVFMLTSEKDEKHDEYYKEFCKRYESLDKERQLLVENNYQ